LIDAEDARSECVKGRRATREITADKIPVDFSFRLGGTFVILSLEEALIS
jgi:hypothetical protein